MDRKPIMLMILDGFGINENEKGNDARPENTGGPHLPGYHRKEKWPWRIFMLFQGMSAKGDPIKRIGTILQNADPERGVRDTGAGDE